MIYNVYVIFQKIFFQLLFYLKILNEKKAKRGKKKERKGKSAAQ